VSVIKRIAVSIRNWSVETARTSSRSAAVGHRCHGRRVDEYEPVGYYVFSNSIYKGATEVKT